MITRHGNPTDLTQSSFIILFKRSLFPLVLLLIFGVFGQTLLPAPILAQQTLSVGSSSGSAGTNVTLAINFTSSSPAATTILQFDLNLPSSLSYVDGSVTTGAVASAAGKTTAANAVGNVIHVLIAGMNNNVIGSGSVGTVGLAIAPGTPSGTLTVGISGIVASDVNANSVSTTGTGGSVTVLVPPDTTAPSVPTNLLAGTYPSPRATAPSVS